VKVLMVGDVVGRPGRRAVAALLPGLRQELGVDLTIANGENAAAGRGLTLSTARELFDAGVDVITSGNHIWDQKEIIPSLDEDAPILRPQNYPPGTPGRGIMTCNGVTIINLQGRTFMLALDCPFRTANAILKQLPARSTIIVDMHGEATSEKVAMGWYLDGRVSAVLGTHTHVGTIDARVLPRGTAFVCDVGMVGSRDSIIGDDVDAVLSRFLSQLPHRLSVAEDSRVLQFNAVLVEIDEATGLARSIARVDREIERRE
jgi:metallophosphoesterase (TIGR00282 family)